MTFEWLYRPVEAIDHWLSGGLSGAGLLVVLLLAALLGLRHATDPDHLFAVTALVAGEEHGRDGDGARRAARLGAWWGLGHAAVLVLVGIPLILAEASMPSWLEAGAERLIGVIIVALALRVLYRWRHRARTGAHAGRSGRQSATIGAIHGIGGTGAIVLLLLTALPTSTDALLALAVFAPMSVVSMTACTGLYGRLLSHPRVALVQSRVGMPALALAGIAFGGWYAL
jgi:hypothetical protein